MLFSIIFTIFLCLHTSFGYFYPMSPQAQDAIRFIVKSTKKICSVSCWMEWFMAIEPEVELTYTDSWLIWLGLKERPTLVEPEEKYYFCTAIAFIICAIGYTVYITISKHYCDKKLSDQRVAPYELEDSSEDESLVSYSSSKALPAASCINESGDMKI